MGSFVDGLPAVVVVVGHYGVGKTTFALNTALQAASAGRTVTLVDLDVVNPYFRSGEYDELLSAHGVRLVAPVYSYAGTGLDIPSLTGAIVPAIDMAYADDTGRALCVIDAGGDDVGATTLGRFSQVIKKGSHEVLYVLNCFRALTPTPQAALTLMRDIEVASHLDVTAVVNNSHLMDDTTAADIAHAAAFGREFCALSGLPLAAQTAPQIFIDRQIQRDSDNCCEYALLPMQPYVCTPWVNR